MQVCDRCWKRDAHPVPATVAVVFAGPEVEEEYHLSQSEAELVRSFINEPSLWAKKGAKDKVREILSLKDKRK